MIQGIHGSPVNLANKSQRHSNKEKSTAGSGLEAYNKGMAASTPKRDNSHMSPPDKNLQTKVTVLSPKFRDLFVTSMGREIRRQNDGYDTDDEVPLSILRKKSDSQKTKEKKGPSGNDSIIISDDQSQVPSSSEGTKGAINTADDPNKGVINRDDDPKSEENKEGAKPEQTQTVADQSRRDEGDVVRGEEVIEEVKDIDIDIDPLTNVNRDQLIEEQRTGGTAEVLNKLLSSIEDINKKLEKLDVVEKEMKEMNEKILKKEDVEEIIQKQLIEVKTTLVSHDLKIKRQQTELNNIDKRIGRRIDAIEAEMEKKEEIEAGLKQKEVEQMIEKAQEGLRKEYGDPKKVEIHTGENSSKPNRNLIIHGMAEDRRVEDITKVQDVAYDIGLTLYRRDIDKTSRLGAFEKGKKRPVKVELVSATTKVDFLKSKSKLLTSELYNDIQVVPDETKEVRHAKAILRQAAYLAKRRGDKVWKRHDLIWVNGVKYTVETVTQIPEELRFKKQADNKGDKEERHHTKPTEQKETTVEDEGVEEMETTEPQDIGSANFRNKNWDQASRAASRAPSDLEVDGAVQLTKRGLAFFTGKTFLSNFYQIEIKFNGKFFKSSEQAYQYEKASVCRDAMRMERIYRAHTPKDAKDIGYEVKTTPLWDKLKDDRMREILDAKFSQNADIRGKLMETYGLYLIEGSTDGYWGAGKRLYSKELLEGRWNGQNRLGEMLVELRTDLRRRGY